MPQWSPSLRMRDPAILWMSDDLGLFALRKLGQLCRRAHAHTAPSERRHQFGRAVVEYFARAMHLPLVHVAQPAGGRLGYPDQLPPFRRPFSIRPYPSKCDAPMRLIAETGYSKHPYNNTGSIPQ